MSIPRRSALASLLLLALPAAAAQAFELVVRDEAERERAHQSQLSPDVLEQPPLIRRGLFPTMRVVAPGAAGQPLRAPLRIEVEFATGPGARIVPSTFRLLYGLLKLDLTERFRAHAHISESGVIAEHTLLPPGAHRLYLQVADDRGRFMERELRFRIDG